MARPGAKPSDTEVEEAIVRVLQAERDARDATAAARVEATARVEAARDTANELTRRAERRIGRIRHAFERRVQSAQREVEAEITALGQAVGEEMHLARREADAVEILAAELTGGDHD